MAPPASYRSTIPNLLFAVPVLHGLLLFVLSEHSPLPFSLDLVHRTWGFHHIRFFDWPVIAAAYAVALAVCVPAVQDYIRGLLRRARESSVGNALAAHPVFSTMLFCGVLLSLFLLAPQKYPFLGDGMLRVHDAVVDGTYGRFRVYHYAYQLLHTWFGMDGTAVLAFSNSLAGVVFGLFLLLTVRELSPSRWHRLIMTALVLAGGGVQLFFGYIEIYGAVTACMMGCVWLLLRAAYGRITVVAPTIGLGLACGLHPVAITLGPGLAVLYLERIRTVVQSKSKRTVLLAGVSIGTICLGLMGLYVMRGTMLRLLPEEPFANALLTIGHQWEVLNAQILAAPTAFVWIWPLGWWWWHRGNRSDATMLVLWAIFGAQFLFAWLFNAHRGSADWDLLAVSGPVCGLIVARFLCDHGIAG